MKNQLSMLGFDYERTGSHTISINGIPTIAEQSEATALFHNLLSDFRENEQKEQLGKLDRLAKSVARAEASGFRRELKHAEMEDLIDRLFACEQPNYTPSGKTIMSMMNMDELDQRF